MRVRAGIAAMALAALLVAPSGAAGGVRDESTSFQINAAHDGYAPASRVRPPLRVRWSTEVGIVSRAVMVAEGKVFAIASQADVPRLLLALDARTGRWVWSRPTNGAALAYDRGRLFTGGDDETLQAHDPATGEPVWTISSGQDAPWPYPVARDGVVYVHSQGPDAGRLNAYAGADGRLLWSAAGGEEGGGAPAVGETAVFASFSSRHLFAYDRSSGALRWERSFQDGPWDDPRTPVYHRGHLYSTEAAAVLEADSGRVAGPMDSAEQPALAGDLGLFTEWTGPVTNRMVARELSSGQVRWRLDEGTWAGPPVLTREHAYFLTLRNRLLAIELANGAIHHSIDVGPSSEDQVRMGGYQLQLSLGEGVLVMARGRNLIALEHAASGSGDPSVGDDRPSPRGGPRPRSCGRAAGQRASRIRAAGMTCVRARQIVARYTRTRRAGRGFRCESLLVSHSDREVSCASRSAAVAWRQRLKRPVRLWR